MRSYLRTYLCAGLVTFTLGGAALAQAPAAAQAPARPTPPTPAKPPVPVAATPEAPAAGKVGDPALPAASREDLLKQLETAKAKLAEDKKAAAEAKKGKDKDAAKTTAEKVKEDGKTIHEIEMRLKALKTTKQPMGDKKPAADKKPMADKAASKPIEAK